jgi:hypothetical protein
MAMSEPVHAAMYPSLLIAVACFTHSSPIFPATLVLQAISRRLSLLAGEVAGSKARAKQLVREGLPGGTPGASGGVGSIEHTVKVGARA